MAQFVAKLPIIAKRKISENGTTVTFEEGMILAKMISCTVTPTQSKVELYGDDDVAEQDNSVTGAGITLNTTHLPTKPAAFMFGSEYKEATEKDPEQIISKDSDEAPEVAYGYIDGHKQNGKKKFRVRILPCVIFNQPAETSNTKGNTVAFTTPSLSGTAKVDPVTSEWKHDYFFDTAIAAIDFLKSTMGIQPAAAQ
ncbi:MAG: hypothetical protein IKB88_02185 [Clostridia bacterium]|nr:hypothetical protein [Clostridia bacterium]